ncbi:Bax inhibitor-1/YccA family protein [Amnibacterium kyonggiense]|uniref:Putative YccA/Bax inhibitor family protein n=1 Tax=Amnibacterium kyonggiense TaxID=595671 RepID=A0A4R7FQX6_9MICO|nr:Bax inhibitor-1/YccA family protein [Amnibacterium kyonggiense]TDS80197.1 putative YccA/Bax inhibitor family protein [Amnibacterium kyonggiense]
MANPALSNNPAFKKGSTVTAADLEELYERPAASPADTGRMTYEDTAVKTVILFAVLLATSAVGWFVPALAIVGALVGFVLAMVNTFKREPSVPLIVLYAAAEGLFVGGISRIFDDRWNGIVAQAGLATLVTVGVTLALFASGKIRASARATKIFLIAMVSYAVFQLVNVVLMITGVAGGTFGLQSGVLGVIIGVAVVIMAAYSLVLDFDQIQQGVRRGIPAKYGWTGAFGIMVTVVWLYVEFLRLIAILRGNN